MKKAYKWIIGLILLGFVMTGLFFTLAPDRIPVHYNTQGQVDRWGSKYEFIILPMVNLLFGGVMAWIAGRENRQGREMNEQVVTGMTAWVLILFNAMWLFFMWKAVDMESSSGGLGELTIKAFLILLSGSFVPIGNKLPKSQRSSLFGLRTKWSMANDRCWQKSQRFGGYAFVIAGILGVLLCAFLPASWGQYVLPTLMLVMTAACIWGSYRIYKQEKME